MAITLNRRENGRGRLVFCLLFAAIIAVACAGVGYSEAGIQVMNSSGNLNRTPSVNPTKSDHGYSVVLYDGKNGLPTSETNALAQTSDGFIWMASYAGLIRYDGRTFERIEDPKGITSVRCLYVDSQDRLWIGTNDMGLFSLSRGEFFHWDKSDGLEALSVRSIAEAKDGTIYIGTSNGVGMIDASLQFTPLDDERCKGQIISELRSGIDGLVYGMANNGSFFSLSDGKIITCLRSEDHLPGSAFAILPDPKRPGFLYVGTEHSICHGSMEEGSFGRDVWDTSPLVDIEKLEYIDDQIWICARSGIGCLENGTLHLLQNIPMDNAFTHVMTDSEGNLWITSSSKGTMKVVPNRFTNLFELYGLPSEAVNSTCLSDGRLFIGTDSKLIVLEDGKKLDYLPITEAVTSSGKVLDTPDNLLTFLDGARVRSIVRDSRGRLWISTSRSQSLLCYDNGKLKQFTEQEGLLSSSVRVVSECEDGSMLVATNDGLNVIEGDRIVKGYGQAQGLEVRLILTLTEGFNHEVIAGSDGDGIYIIDPDGIKHIGAEDGLTSEIVMRIRRSRTRDLYWIVTGNSLACMTPDYQVKTIREFPFANNTDLYENSRGDLWLMGTSGIRVILSEDLMADEPAEPIFFGTPNGLPCVVSANSYSELTADGDLYLSGNEGVVQFNIEESLEYSGEIEASVPYISADGKLIYPDDDGSFFVASAVRKLTVYPYVFNYSLANPQVSYRLVGFDLEDTSVSQNELVPVYYTNLDNGIYQFVISVKNPFTHKERTVSFRIVKGKVSTIGNDGSIIMDVASLFFMGGLLIYTALYRKRGRMDDRIFFAMIITNMVLAVSDALTHLMDVNGFAVTRPVMIIGNLVFFTAFEIFPYLYLLYLDYQAYRSAERIQRLQPWYAIPWILILILLLASTLTGWIFSVDAEGVYHPGPWNSLIFVPLAFYFLSGLLKVKKINIHLMYLGILLLLSRIAWGIWFRDISSTAMTYTLFLICAHIYVMNLPLMEEST